MRRGLAVRLTTAYRDPAPKKVVVTLVERDGRARSFHVANVNAKTLRPMLYTNIDRRSHLMTDGAPVYRKLGLEFASHGAVDHEHREYSRRGSHSNTAENFFSIFKRGVIGTYHHMSEAHLHRYTAEFDFRYNSRTVSDGERAALALAGMECKRLTYRRPRFVAA